jgi:hypothetical protein
MLLVDDAVATQRTIEPTWCENHSRVTAFGVYMFTNEPRKVEPRESEESEITRFTSQNSPIDP